MTSKTDVREALQREAVRVKSALSDFAALASPRKKRIAEPADTPEPPPAAVPMGKPVALEPAESLGDWFDDDAPAESAPSGAGDFFGGGESWRGESETDFSPGSGADFSEGFEAEIDVPAKAGQETLSVPAIAVSENTPADGMPKPPEAINDVLDGFEW